MDKKFYITTAIDYINGKPHIGHSYEKVAADVLARFHRARGEDIRFLTGTDEHGAKVEQFAKETGKPIEEFAEETAGFFKTAWDNLNVKYDRFIRTTDKDHEEVVHDFLTKIKDNGYLYEGDYEGLYCVGHEAFITEKELVNGLCPEHQKAPELIKEKNWFFKVTAFTDTIKERIEANQFEIWPKTSRNEVLGFLADFKDIAVTRPNVKWGISVPWDPEQTIYVWVDALINYYTGAKAEGKDYWPADVHVIGRDITKFHCVIWPALLLAAGLEIPKAVVIHGYLTLNGQKISKSLGNIVDPNDWVTKFGSDAVRYFLLREVPFASDGDISEEKLRARYEGDLANGLGNLVSRITTLVEKFSDGKIDAEVAPNTALGETDEQVEKYHFHQALQEIWQAVSWCNETVDQNKLWELGKSDPEKFKRVASEVVMTIKIIAEKLTPFIPTAAAKITAAVTAEKITKIEPLFPRIP
jgi:methionyl-tRNA synthetase